jgi:hypothetical protein
MRNGLMTDPGFKRWRGGAGVCNGLCSVAEGPGQVKSGPVKLSPVKASQGLGKDWDWWWDKGETGSGAATAVLKAVVRGGEIS